MKQKIVLAVLVAAACVAATPTKGRSKRSFSWLPSFLGGGSAVVTEEKIDSTNAAPVIVDNGIAGSNPAFNGPYPAAIGSIIGSGQLINNQMHYPVWHVHKYQGMRLQPLPISLVHDNVGTVQGNAAFYQGNANAGQDNTEAVDPVQNHVDIPDTESRLPPVDPQIQSWLTPELIKMAREYGVTDFSKAPSLEEAMNLLGTTTKEETVEAVKEFAATEDGRNLIRQYIEGGSIFGGSDNETAASENVEETEYETNPVAVDNYQGQGTTQIGQYFLPNYQGQLLRQFATFGSNPAQTEQQSADENADEVETVTPTNLFGRVTQWANFLNPLTNRQEIPIPPSEGEIAEPIVEVSDSAGVEQADLQNVQILKSKGPYVRVKLPFAGFNPTPQYYIDPKYLNHGRNLLAQQGAHIGPVAPVQYVPFAVQKPIEIYQRVATNYVQPAQTPEAVENPEISQFTQPAFDSVNPVSSAQPINFQTSIYGLPQVQDQQLPSTDEANAFVQPNAQVAQISQPAQPAQPVQRESNSFNIGQPIDFHTQIYNVPNQVNSQQLASADVAQNFVQPVSFANHAIQVAEPIQVYQDVQPISNLEVPNNEAQQFQRYVPVAAPINSATNIGQLPLVSSANYEVFRNAPRIISSYGSPALPFTYGEIQSPNTFYISPQASKAYIHQEYEVRPSASQVVEQKVRLNEPVPSEVENTIEDENQGEEENQEENQEVEEAVNEEQEEIAAQSNSNDDEIAPDTNRNDGDNQSEQSKSIDVTAKQKVENVDTNANTNTEPAVESPSSTEAPIHYNLRPTMRPTVQVMKKRPIEQQTANSHIQRVSKNIHATGKVHRSDPNAMEMTMRHMVQTNNHNEN